VRSLPMQSSQSIRIHLADRSPCSGGLYMSSTRSCRRGIFSGRLHWARRSLCQLSGPTTSRNGLLPGSADQPLTPLTPVTLSHASHASHALALSRPHGMVFGSLVSTFCWLQQSLRVFYEDDFCGPISNVPRPVRLQLEDPSREAICKSCMPESGPPPCMLLRACPQPIPPP